MRLEPGLSPSEMADEFFFLPAEVAGLPQRDVQSNTDSATAIYALEDDPANPRFGLVVAIQVEPKDRAADVVLAIERERWGDLADHEVTASGDGTTGEPAYREFRRSFSQAQFLLANRPIYFLIWYRAGDDYAFMVIGDRAEVREGLARAVAENFSSA